MSVSISAAPRHWAEIRNKCCAGRTGAAKEVFEPTQVWRHGALRALRVSHAVCVWLLFFSNTSRSDVSVGVRATARRRAVRSESACPRGHVRATELSARLKLKMNNFLRLLFCFFDTDQTQLGNPSRQKKGLTGKNVLVPLAEVACSCHGVLLACSCWHLEEHCVSASC